MANDYGVIVIGGGLGGLTVAALIAHASRKTLLIERNHEIGGAASSYQVGKLFVEASLHETSDPHDPIDPKHHALARLGVLDDVEWVPTGSMYEVRGGPIGEPFVMPDDFSKAKSAHYADRRLSISLFSATFGLSARPAELGLKSYSTFLLPRWMKQLADYRRCGELMATMPAEAMPPIAIVDYSAIDSGLGGPPYSVAVVGVDRASNWSGLDGAGYNAKRNRWRDALLEALTSCFRASPPKLLRLLSLPRARSAPISMRRKAPSTGSHRRLRLVQSGRGCNSRQIRQSAGSIWLHHMLAVAASRGRS
jgi:NAD(P)-binding Rossmann-like domain